MVKYEKNQGYLYQTGKELGGLVIYSSVVREDGVTKSYSAPEYPAMETSTILALETMARIHNIGV